MPTYNFKRNSSVFIVSAGNRYKLDISDINFSQTFREESYQVKTLHGTIQSAHTEEFFEGSVTNSAGNANFSFTIPALSEADFTIIETLLISANTFDIFIEADTETFKLETCVITNGAFVIERSRPLSIDIQGQAGKLVKNATVTGTLVSRSGTRTYITNPTISIDINGSSLDSVTSISLELQNEVNWTGYKTIQGALAATSATNSMYPSSFTVSKKILSGSISQYLSDTNNSTVNTWDTSASMTIKAGNGLSGGAFRGFSFGPATCSFTNRLAVGTLYQQSYDWRLVANPSNLATILKYETD